MSCAPWTHTMPHVTLPQPPLKLIPPTHPCVAGPSPPCIPVMYHRSQNLFAFLLTFDFRSKPAFVIPPFLFLVRDQVLWSLSWFPSWKWSLPWLSSLKRSSCIVGHKPHFYLLCVSSHGVLSRIAVPRSSPIEHLLATYRSSSVEHILDLHASSHGKTTYFYFD